MGRVVKSIRSIVHGEGVLSETILLYSHRTLSPLTAYLFPIYLLNINYI